jgi:hypothetical protein
MKRFRTLLISLGAGLILILTTIFGGGGHKLPPQRGGTGQVAQPTVQRTPPPKASTQKVVKP